MSTKIVTATYIYPEGSKVTPHDDSDIGVPNWGNPVCECEHCGYMILESEFKDVKVEL